MGPQNQELFDGQRDRVTDKQKDQMKNLCAPLKEITKEKTINNHFTCRYCDVEAFDLTSQIHIHPTKKIDFSDSIKEIKYC